MAAPMTTPWTVPWTARRVARVVALVATLGATLGAAVLPAVGADARFAFPAEGVAVFSGSLTEASVDAFVAAAQGRAVKSLLITSPGGSVLAGVRLGWWVHRQGVDVVVDRLCMSACANYVFPAGRERIIRPDALVVWHGGALQRNFRAARERLARVQAAQAAGETVSDEDARFLAENLAKFPLWHAQVEAQQALFAALGVDEWITRLGQEPVDFGRSWTLTVPAMQRLGIGLTLADAAYGLPRDVERRAAAIKLTAVPLALTVHAADGGLAVRPAEGGGVSP